MTPEEERRKFWDRLIKQIHRYQSKLDPPRFFVKIKARKRRIDAGESKPEEEKDQPDTEATP